MGKTNVSEEGRKSAVYKSTEEPIVYMAVVKLNGSEPEDTIIGEDGRTYTKTDRVDFDLKAIPKPKMDVLCKAVLDGMNRILQQPDGREMLDAKTAARKARQAKQARTLGSVYFTSKKAR